MFCHVHGINFFISRHNTWDFFLIYCISEDFTRRKFFYLEDTLIRGILWCVCENLKQQLIVHSVWIYCHHHCHSHIWTYKRIAQPTCLFPNWEKLREDGGEIFVVIKVEKMKLMAATLKKIGQSLGFEKTYYRCIRQRWKINLIFRYLSTI